MIKNTPATRLLGTFLIAAVIVILAFFSRQDRSCGWNPLEPSYHCAPVQ
jgi:hypothetical protein